MGRPQYIVEHMEEDEEGSASFPHWALLEYRQMLLLVGPGSTVHFTGLSPGSASSLRAALSSSSSSKPCAEFQVHTEGILDFAAKAQVPISAICLLDPKAPQALSVRDASPPPNGYSHFLLGGILGDDPPRDRTSALRAHGFPGRHLGTMQMTTDTALGVTKRVVEDHLALGLEGTEQEGPTGATMQWVDQPELKFGGGESVEMPFRYMVDEERTKAYRGKPEPLMPEGMRQHIRNDLDRAFEF
ncbi:DUF431-domain-containing protein [Acaromyces ingoldii]|uniref:DUF431-domain-containing protein n=1 Tax=Acaromyces ingoldii TaxID=215250 RepID=A0A316YTQ1_9BASI|nr:DUF431-domain-containing protein [Acaromyces ingoldii]PWN92426.1 DUF431-domain-containing protein [Acaromyces ingoldii]